MIPVLQLQIQLNNKLQGIDQILYDSAQLFHPRAEPFFYLCRHKSFVLIDK